MGQDELRQKLSETEALGADDANIARMLGRLPRANAPKDFDLYLRSRIANGAPAETARPILFPVLKYAVPLGLILAISGFIIFGGYLTPEDGTPPAIAESPRTTETIPERAVVQGDTKDVNFAKTQVGGENPQPPKREEIASDVRKTSNLTSAPKEQSSHGSVDRALSSANRSRFPRGINPEYLVREPAPNAMNTKVEIATREVLKMLGVDADIVDDAWHVKAVNAGSSASRAGIQIGDIIREINDRKAGRTIEFTGQFAGSSITVLRNERPIRIDLLKKQP